MKRGFAFVKETGLVVPVLSLLAFGTAGCELLPGLLAGPGAPTTDPAFTTASLTVTVESVEGVIDGQPLDASMCEASGFRSGTAVDLDVQMPALATSITISSSGTDGSDQNPYGEGGGDLLADAGPPPALADAGPPPPLADAGPLPPRLDAGAVLGSGSNSFDPRGSSGATILACGPDGTCVAPDDFGVQIAQLSDRRSVVVDGIWADGDRVHIEMSYREIP